MSISRFVQVVFSLFLLLMTVLGTFAVLLFINQRNLNRSQKYRFDSYLLADELRQSSDDLTRFVRTYVVTGDPRYEQYYWDVLAIRNGEKPRPRHYERIYWDFVAADEGVSGADARHASLQQLLADLGLPADETALLSEAQARSDSLVRIEDVAIHAVKGLYADSTGTFTVHGHPDRELAVRLLNDEDYHRHKAGIMRPIGEFLARLDTRTTSTVQAYARRSDLYLDVIMVVLFTLLVLTLLSWAMVFRRVAAPVRALEEQTVTVAEDLDRLRRVTRQIADGNLAGVFTARARKLHLTSRDEIGHLARTHDDMIANLQETGEAIALVTAELSAKTAQLVVANEELRRLSAAKSEFVAAASHDLRTPLMTILESVRLIEDGALGPVAEEQREYLRYARQETLRLRDLINTVLDAARIEQGKLEARPGRVDVVEQLAQVRAGYETVAQARSLQIATEVMPGPLAVVCDPGHYQRVLTNLVSNAVKFTPAGGRITLQAEPGGDGTVRTSVRDTGQGIPRSQHHRVFQKFEQIHHPGGELHAGTGLGLALCKELVEMNCGTIGFESEEGIGSVFYFTLPAWPAGKDGER